MEALNTTFNTTFQMFQCKRSSKFQEVQMLFHLSWEKKNFKKSNQSKNKRKVMTNKTTKIKRLKIQLVKQVLIEVSD